MLFCVGFVDVLVLVFSVQGQGQTVVVATLLEGGPADILIRIF
jgi:hypothetical protein